MSDITILYYDSIFCKIQASPSICREIREKFKFRVNNYFFNPKYKAGIWDGYITLFKTNNNLLYTGLIHKVIDFAKSFGYSIQISSKYKNNFDEITEEENKEFCESLGLPFVLRDYQYKSIYHALNTKKMVVVSATSSGKSVVIYCIIQYLLKYVFCDEKKKHKKVLLVVPTKSLVHQMKDDFKNYGSDFDVHLIYQDQEKQTKNPVIISTWQSIYKQPKKWFDQFGAILVDECHGGSAVCLRGILEKSNTPWKIGFTGTLQDKEYKANLMTIIGLFGKPKEFIRTRELIDSGFATNLKIIVKQITYNEQDKKLISSGKIDPDTNKKRKFSYQEESDFLIKHKHRNSLIIFLIKNMDGNTLILSKSISHIDALYNVLRKIIPKNRNVYKIIGKTKTEIREETRKKINTEKNGIIIATSSLMSTGINIPNLQNLLFATGNKSRIKTLQSVGRVLRLYDNKDICTVYDLVDDLRYKRSTNYSFKHFMERSKIYSEQHLDFSINKLILP